MGYKMKKQSGSSDTPIYKVNLPDGINAEANRDGSIYVNKNLKGKKLDNAIKHEKVHLDQMKRGDLDYDGKNVYWKGKVFSRTTMLEGAKNLPWEREAYNKEKKK